MRRELHNESSPDWRRTFTVQGANLVGFAAAFELEKSQDLTLLSRQIPPRVAMCHSSHIAGLPHIEGVLQQASFRWSRGIELARNSSIELLMMISGRKQIAEAITLSDLKGTDRFAVFGMLESESKISDLFSLIETKLDKVRRNDNLLLLDEKKKKTISKAHEVSPQISADHLVTMLNEESAILVFR
jgi:tRNA threonylcarbamoyladenosine modification (KEOPS) complex Cgi121 subunit